MFTDIKPYYLDKSQSDSIFFFLYVAILLYHYEPSGVESVIDWSRAKAMLSFPSKSRSDLC